MKSFDVAVIGGGLLGCFAARSLCRFKLKTVLIEADEDVCRGISRANSAVIYPGYDNKPGSLKAQMTVRANAYFNRLCDELEVEFIRRGSLLLSFDEASDNALHKKLRDGTVSKVPGLRLISGQEAMELEPMLAHTPRLALHAPGTGTVNPWQLGIAAFENAVYNGCEPMLEASVLGMEKADGGYILKTNKDEVFCKAVINCAGLSADKLREMLFEPELRLHFDASDFLVFDKHAPRPDMILFGESPKGKSISLIPTVEGNLLIESRLRELDLPPFAFNPEARETLLSEAGKIVRGIDADNIIRSFAAVRPNLRQVKKVGGEYVPTDKNLPSFAIDRPEPGFISLIGIKTPGLSCSNELGCHVSDMMADYLGAEENKSFVSRRPAIKQLRNLSRAEQARLCKENPDYSEIVCLCEGISKAEIKEAIRRGAKSVEGVKRRLGTSMGPCQGSRCNYAISKILEGGK